MEGQTNLYNWIITDLFEWRRYIYYLRRSINSSKYKIGKCAICNFEGDTELHHIIPLMKGGNILQNNILELCIMCHYRMHPNGLMKHKLLSFTKFLKENCIEKKNNFS